MDTTTKRTGTDIDDGDDDTAGTIEDSTENDIDDAPDSGAEDDDDLDSAS